MISQKDKEIFLKVLSDAVSGNVLLEIPEGTDVRALYNLSCAHKVTGAIWHALKGITPSDEMQKELLSRLSKHAANAGKQLVLQDYYTETAVNICREKGVKFALLKGAVLKHFYPDATMRSSCDIDILVDKERIDEIVGEFIKLGFDYHEEQDSDEAKHAKLAKDSVVVELHRALCFDGAFGGHYDNPFSAFETVDGVEYTLCPEEFYVYNLVHASQHFMKGVNTLRALCDLYLICRKYPDMDREKVSEILGITGMSGFEKAMSNLVKAVFGEIKAEDELYTVLDYVIMNPVRADTVLSELQREKVSGNSGKIQKLTIALRRVFPSYKYICRRYRNAKKSRLLYPYYVVKRIFDAGNEGRIKEQLDAMGRVSDDEMSMIATVRRYSGLN